jgi:hypothetical protein
MKAILCLCAILGATCVFPPSCASGATTNQVPAKLSIEQAIALARDYCKGKVDVPEDAPATVRETGGKYIVTFPQPLQLDILHGDIYARVTLDSITGKIIDSERSE